MTSIEVVCRKICKIDAKVEAMAKTSLFFKTEMKKNNTGPFKLR